MASIQTDTANAAELLEEFLHTVGDCRLLTSRKVLGPIPEAEREIDPAELDNFLRLDDYIDRMNAIFKRTPPGQLDLGFSQRSNIANQENIRYGRNIIICPKTKKPKRAKTDANATANTNTNAENQENSENAPNMAMQE